jgi:hypothetical protein
MDHNLSRLVDIRRAINAVAAGTSSQNGNTIDTLGYDSVCFIVAFGALTATQVTSIKVQQGDQSDASDMADISGAATGNMADADGNKLLCVEVYRPSKRYVRVVVVRGTANAVIDGGIALLYRAAQLPPALHSTMSLAPVIKQV